MSEWKVVMTPEFRKELWEIHNYIAKTLLAPETAGKQTKRIWAMVKRLDFMPLRHSLYNREPWRSRKIRTLPIDNYIVLYLPNEETKDVFILHVFYGGRDIDDVLKKNENTPVSN